jgi:hypothetical protein
MKAYYKNLVTLRKGLLKAGYGYDEIKTIMIEFRENSSTAFRESNFIEEMPSFVLDGAFWWHDSPQGTNYWGGIGEKLREVNNENT